MGFKSGFKKNQATEDDVTITDRPFADGTTMQVSYMRLRLDSWYELLDEDERVARMYAPEITPAEVARFTDDAPDQPRQLHPGREPLRRRRALPDLGPRPPQRQPRIIRRDFDTVDGGLAGLHFVSVQRIDRRLRHHPERDERRQRLLPQPRDHRHDQQRHQRVHLRPQTRQLHHPRHARLRSYPLYPGQAAALA